MSAAAPWSVKGIDPKAREVAKDLARRSGMTLGEWLNTMIMDDEDDGVATLPRRPHAAESIDRRGRSRRLDDAYDRYDGDSETLQRVAASVDAIAARLEAAERRSTVAIQGVDQAVTGLVRRLDGADVQTRAYGRRIDDISEELKEGHRRLRTFEQEVGPETRENLKSIETGVGAIASRLYDMEERQRSSVNELRTRMDAVEKTAAPGAGTDLMAQVGARLDGAQARTAEALKDLERSFAGLDQRLKFAEGRVEPEGLREAARFEKLAETLARQVETNRTDMMRRLDTAEAEGRMERIERAMAGLGDSVRTAEQRSAQGIEAMGREVMRIAQNLTGRAASAESRLQGVDGRLQGLDSAVQRIDVKVGQVEAATSDKIARVGQAIATDLTASLNEKTAALTAGVNEKTAALNEAFAEKSAGLNEKLDRDMGRYAQAVEQRLNRTDDQHAMALEKLGGEITRISDRLADRIAQSERKSSQALEDIGRRLADSSDRIEQTYDRASGELAERMRLSEERTARLLEEARERLEQRGVREERPSLQGPSLRRDPADMVQPDWRAAAFPDDFASADAAQDPWATEPLADAFEPAPFPSLAGARDARPSAAEGFTARLTQSEPEPVYIERQPEPAPAEPTFARQAFGSVAPAVAAPASEPVYEPAQPDPQPAPTAFGNFGGADVSDALAATAPQAFAHPVAATQGLSGGGFDAGGDEFAAETDFVDPRTLRANLAAGASAARGQSTRSAIDAARAAMSVPAEAAPTARGGFGLKRGGKSRLQERLDKQSTTGSTIRKALLASVTGVAVVTAGYSTLKLTGHDTSNLPGMDTVKQALGLSASTPGLPSASDATPLAAVALTPTGITADSAEGSEAQTLFDQAIEQLDTNQSTGIATLTRAANMGLPAAQLKLVSLYETGGNGVSINPTEARTWARRAAEGNDPRGMHAYGMYLFDGVGGAANKPEALNWLVKAAGRGLVDSQYNVAHIYETGDTGIAANPTEAFKWYLIASRSGDQQAQGAVERLTPALPAAGRRTARAEAEQFQVEPLA